MAIKIDPSYFGPSVQHTQYDLTQMVYALDGSTRNLPQIQFEIPTPLGTRVYVTYRNGFDPPSSSETAWSPSYFSYVSPTESEYTFDSTELFFDSTEVTFDRT